MAVEVVVLVDMAGVLAVDATRKGAWQAGFAGRLKTKPHEQFQLLLCDVTTCGAEQRALLDKILLEADGHLSAASWNRYIEHTKSLFGGDRKSQLQRLVNKALELIPEEDNKDSEDYLSLLLCSAYLKR